MKCQTCDQELTASEAITDPRTGHAWHVEHYGAAEDVVAQVATMQVARTT